MKNNILLVGCGGIGSRHLQSLALCSTKLDICVIDTNPESLEKARKIYELSDKQLNHKLSFEHSIPSVGKTYDICIMSTSSQNRLSLVDEILKKLKIKYWIIEKILSQNIKDLHEIGKIIRNHNCIGWVNTPNRAQKWFKDIKEEISSKKIIGTVEGNNWGLMCNTIHYLDLFSWMTSQKLISINSQNLNKSWFKSKREGYMEVDGELVAYYSDGAILHIRCNTLENIKGKKLNYSFENWVLDPSNGIARNIKSKRIIPGEIKPQSLMTNIFVDQLINHNYCELPNLDESISMHEIFLKAILPHWNNYSKTIDNDIPIT